MNSDQIKIIGPSILFAENASFSKLNSQPLESNKIKDLARQYLAIADLIKKDIQQIEQGGVSETEEELWLTLRRLHNKIEDAGLSLFNAALIVLVKVDLANFNQEIGKSTEALTKTAEQIKQIHQTIGIVVKAVGIVLDVVGQLTSGGSFQFTNVISPVLQLLELAGVQDLPKL